MINVETSFGWFLSFSSKLLLQIWIRQISSTAFLFQLFQLGLANFSVGYVPLLLLTEYKLLRHSFSLPRKTWLMKSHSSHLRHALYKKQGQREILSSWLIKCVAGGVICHSPVVIPRWQTLYQRAFIFAGSCTNYSAGKILPPNSSRSFPSLAIRYVDNRCIVFLKEWIENPAIRVLSQEDFSASSWTGSGHHEQFVGFLLIPKTAS